MVGGVFEGTNGDPVTGTYTTIHTITTNPPQAWSSVSVNLGNYRYLRYRGPGESFGNVAEIQFFRNGTLLTGPGYGTSGSWSDSGATFNKALDGNVNTFFDAPTDAGYVGIDTVGATSSGKIRFYPRRDHTDRMIGGVFEGTNGDPVNGPYAAIYTITSNPPLAWNEVGVDLKDYRSLRYRGPIDSFGNVAEIEFYRDGVKLTGVGFGTPGSWNSQGSTFGKALDGNIDTFFDAATSAAYVGIDTAAAPAGPFTLTVVDGSGSGSYAAGTMVTVTANTPAVSGLEFAQWIGVLRVEDTNILADPFMATTTATMPSMNVTIEAAYAGAGYFADSIRYYPRAGFTERMAGGVFEGTDGDPVNGPYTTIYTIRENPPLKWSLVGGVSLANYRYLRYRGPDGSFGNVADIAFTRNGVKVTGVGFGTPGSLNNAGNTFAKALDGNVISFFDGPTPNNCYVGVDTGPLPAMFTLTVDRGTGDGDYMAGTIVTVSADPPPTGQEFARWTDDIVILSNPFLATTTAIIPSMDVKIAATYGAVSSIGKIRFYPRRDHTDRMIGGVFEGTRGDPINGPYAPIYTITSNPPLDWNEISADLKDYRYLRYRGPTDSFGNVAEIEFYRNGVKLTGAGFGTPGSWSNQGSTFDKALDGNLNTFFDASINTGAYVGIDTQAFSITIPNGSFETPDFADGSGLAQPTPGVYYDWNYDQVPAGGGQFIITDSNDSLFPNTTGNGLLPGPADGQQFAILGTARGGQSTSITNISPLATLQSGRTYTLSVAAGNEITSQFSLHTGSLKIAVLASDTVVAENSISYATIPLGSFKLVLTSFSAGESSAGRPLNIRITYTAGPDAGDNGCFDNVTLGIETSATISSDKIRFYPRRDHTDRMIGGVFEGTNGDPVNGPYEAVYTIASNPPLAWNEVSVDLKNYRYLRYRGPTDSFGNVAEIEFYRNEVKLTGVSFGTPGSWNSEGSTFDKAFDGNLGTFFDATINTGAYTGIDTR